MYHDVQISVPNKLCIRLFLVSLVLCVLIWHLDISDRIHQWHGWSMFSVLSCCFDMLKHRKLLRDDIIFLLEPTEYMHIYSYVGRRILKTTQTTKVKYPHSNMFMIFKFPVMATYHLNLNGSTVAFNTLRLRQKGRHFADDVFKCIFLNGNLWISIKISLKFVRKGQINNIPSLV